MKTCSKPPSRSFFGAPILKPHRVESGGVESGGVESGGVESG